MGQIRTYKDLDAWRLGMDVIEMTYELTADFPAEERYGLVSQMRRAALSIPSNVAEGQAVDSPKWTLRHINIALGSCAELETQLEASIRLKFLIVEQAHSLSELLTRVRKVLYGLRRERRRRLVVQSITVCSLIAVVIVQAL